MASSEEEVWMRPGAVHPGVYLKRYLEQSTHKKVEILSVECGLRVDYLNLLMGEAACVTADVAFRLGDATKSGPWTWIDLQIAFDMWYANSRRAGSKEAHSGATPAPLNIML
jgi:plasmid maintenance system antidote protein VapI